MAVTPLDIVKFLASIGRKRSHRKGFSAEELEEYYKNLKKSNKVNVIGVDRESLGQNVVTGSNTHSYYDGHSSDEVLPGYIYKQMFPLSSVDPKTGDEVVNFFHWTNPDNVESILDKGLVETLGADASRWQKRAGVWTSYGDNNPMSYDFVTKNGINEKGFNQVPLKISIPRKEYENMRVDHTGRTFNDQVAVFRAPEDARYGSVKIKNTKGRNVTRKVAIPPQYIERYTLPENWTMPVNSERAYRNIGGVSHEVTGWRPSMPEGALSLEDVAYRLDLKKSPEPLGISYGNNKEAKEARDALSEAILKEFREDPKGARSKLVNQKSMSFGYPSVRDFAEGMMEHNKAFNDKLLKEVEDDIKNGVLDPNHQVKIHPEYEQFGYNYKRGEDYLAHKVKNMAGYDHFIEDLPDGLTPYQYVAYIQDMPRQQSGAFARGYEAMPALEEKDLVRTNSLLNDMYGDRASMKNFTEFTASSNGGNRFRSKRSVSDKFKKNNVVSMANEGSTADYLEKSGVPVDDFNYWVMKRDNSGNNFRQDMSKLPLKERYRYDPYLTKDDRLGSLYFSPTKGWMKKQFSDMKRLDSRETMKSVRDDVSGKYNDAYAYAPYNVAFDKNETMTDEMRDYLVNAWKEKFKADSLNKVVGHQIGRKVGGYRGKRGKYGMDME